MYIKEVNKMKKILISSVILLSGTMPSIAYEYPTDATVRYSLDCMAALGGINDQNLYTCSCRYDAIREGLTFIDYEDGVTYERNRAMPGEKGGFFRDNKRGEENYHKLVEVREIADKSCTVVKQVKRIAPTSSQ